MGAGEGRLSSGWRMLGPMQGKGSIIGCNVWNIRWQNASILWRMLDYCKAKEASSGAMYKISDEKMCMAPLTLPSYRFAEAFFAASLSASMCIGDLLNGRLNKVCRTCTGTSPASTRFKNSQRTLGNSFRLAAWNISWSRAWWNVTWIEYVQWSHNLSGYCEWCNVRTSELMSAPVCIWSGGTTHTFI